MARNFDYSKRDGQINFIPPNKNRYGVALLSLDNPNMPYEGMNDRGLFVAISAVPHSDTTVNILKPIRKSLEMVKVILQNASNIDEAMAQFDKYSIAFGEFLGNPPIHFKIVERGGDGVVVEFLHNRRVIIGDKKGKILTNHYLSDLTIKPNSSTSLQRYRIVEKNLHENLNVEESFNILRRCKQQDTVWSTVYNLTRQELYLQYEEGEIVKFNLKDELYANREPIFYKMQNLKAKRVFLEENPLLKIRPHFGYGSENSRYYGARVLLNSSETQAYGLEITRFKTRHDDFSMMGIILEQRLWDWFNMSIGTVGYFDYKGENSIGLVSNLGWEPNNHIPFRPFVTYRNDTIFRKDNTKTIHSINIGFKFEF